MSFILPSAAAYLRGGSPEVQGWWSNRVLVAGVASSGACVAVGLWMAWRRWTNGDAVDRRLIDGVLLASVPLLMVLTIGLLYLPWR